MNNPFAMMYRLTERGRGLACDTDGIGLGLVALVEKTYGDGRPVYRLRPRAE